MNKFEFWITPYSEVLLNLYAGLLCYLWENAYGLISVVSKEYIPSQYKFLLKEARCCKCHICRRTSHVSWWCLPHPFLGNSESIDIVSSQWSLLPHIPVQHWFGETCHMFVSRLWMENPTPRALYSLLKTHYSIWTNSKSSLSVNFFCIVGFLQI